jgi:hypothetical protein
VCKDFYSGGICASLSLVVCPKKQRPELVGALPLRAVLRRFYTICTAAFFSAIGEPRRSSFDLTVAVVHGVGM